MSATRNPARAAVKIDNDVELISGQIRALRELAKQDDEAPIGEGQRYDFSIRWGTVLAGRLRRLVHYSSLGRLDDADERTFDALGVAAAQRAGCMPRQEILDLLAVASLFAHRVHGQPLSIPSAFSSSANRLRA